MISFNVCSWPRHFVSCKMTICDSVYKSPTVRLILSKVNPVHTFSQLISKTFFHINLVILLGNKLDTEHPLWCISSRVYVFIHLPITYNELLVNVFLATSFDAKRTELIHLQCLLTFRHRSFTFKF